MGKSNNSILPYNQFTSNASTVSTTSLNQVSKSNISRVEYELRKKQV